MKRKQGNYLQLSRLLFRDDNEIFNTLSYQAKWLYVVLNELEHKFSGTNKEDYFWRSNEELARDTGMKLSTLKQAKKELQDKNVVQSWQMHWRDPTTGKKSEKHVTAYRIKE